MTPRRYLFWIAVVIVFALLASVPAAAPQAAGQATAAPTASVGTPADVITFGPGSFNLRPVSGLADLSSYQATLSIDFKGKEGGQASQWTEKFVLLASSKPAVRALTATFKGKAPAAEFIAPWSAAMNGVFYWRAEDGSCIGRAIEALADPNAPPLVWEPADFLPGVIGAEEAGAKKVNGTAAKGYKFDERALGAAGRATATGEVWVADEGGYVLKFSLTVKGGPEYFGEGGEGTLTFAYDVTKAGQPVTIALPRDCPEGLVDAPLMADAQDVQRFPGATLYTTKSTLAQVAAFYQQELPKTRWELDGKPSIEDKAGLINFKQGKSRLTVLILVGDGGTQVRLLLTSA
jgi:hypothetical protein